MTTSTDVNATLAMVLTDANTLTLKKSKAGVEGIKALLDGYKASNIKGALESTSKARTKKDFIKALVTLIEAIKVTQEPDGDYADDDKFNELDGFVTEIRSELDSAQKSFLKVGKCLCQALAQLKADGGTQKDFLEWSDKYCEIKKAQAYKLMKVYKDFGDESDFNGTSMRVLYTLTGQDEKVIDKARELAKINKLDSASLDRLLDKTVKVEPKVPSTPSVSGGTVAAKGDVLPFEPDTKEPSGIDMVGVAAKQERENKALKDEIKELKTNPVKVDEVQESETVTELNKTIATLNETIVQLQRELTSTTKINTIQELPQFDSPCAATCIGLELDNAKDKIKINKAYRALAKIFTASTCPTGSTKLKTAREALLSSI